MLAQGAEPATYLKMKIGLGEERMGRSAALDWAIKLAWCPMCLGFWVGVACTGDVLAASGTAVAAETIHRIMRRL